MAADTKGVQVKLQAVQSALKAPKDQTGRFGKHRSAEKILEAVKPLLNEHGLILVLSDDIEEVGGRNYVKASAVVSDGSATIEASGLAWEGDVSRGLDASQVTGIASSYARKYALCGLFAIDDTKDADTSEYGSSDKPTDRQRAEVFSLLKHLDVSTAEMNKYVTQKYSLDLTKLTSGEANNLLGILRKDAARSMEPTA